MHSPKEQFTMSLQTLLNITSQFGQAFHIVDANSVATGLIVIGMAILLLALIAGVSYGAIKAVKEVPNMPFRQFVMMVLAIAAFMIVLGILLP